MRRRAERRLSADERNDWARLVSTVAPMSGRTPPRVEAPPPARIAVAPLPRDPPVRVQPSTPLPATVDLDKRNAERLRRGQWVIDGRLDLHGHRQHEAHDELRRFLAMHWAAGSRCLVVVTGKGARGDGVLRANLPRWLEEPDLRPKVLALHPAAPKDGGGGAWYLLLRRQRD